MDKVYGEGTSKALAGEEIRNTPEIYDNMQKGAQNYIDNNPNQTYQTHMWTNSAGDLAGFKVQNQEAVNLDKSFNQQNNENINTRDILQTGSSIVSGDTTTKDDSTNVRDGIFVTDKNVTDTRDQNISGSETVAGDKVTMDNTTSSVSGSTYVNKDIVDTEDSYRGGDALDGKMVDVAFDNTKSTEFMAVNKVNQEATESGIDSQSSKSLEAAMVHNWESRGISMSESVNDSSSIGSSQSGGLKIDSGSSLVGGVIEKVAGAGGYANFEARSSQQTEEQEGQRFNSFNAVAREFITAANGDTEKLAQMSNEFERRMVERADEQVNHSGNAANKESDNITDNNKKNGFSGDYIGGA